MTGFTELMLVTFVFAAVIGHGVWMATTATNPWADRPGFSNRPWNANKMTLGQIHTYGRIQAIVGAIGYALIIAAIFGAFGPVKNIYIITF